MKRTVLGAIVLCFAAMAAAQPNPQSAQPAAGSASGSASASGSQTSDSSSVDEDSDDVDALRQEYLKLRDELYKSRARAAAVASALYSSKITIKLAYDTARYYAVDRAVIRLDRASVYDDTQGAIATDDAVRFEGWIAPGKHQVSIRIEATGKDDPRFSSATEASFVVEAVAGKDLEITAHAKDGGDIPYQWKKTEHGTYQLTIGADVQTVKRAAAK